MLVKGLCRNGKMDDGMQLVNVMKMQNCTPDENVYGILVNGYLKSF
jgi:pentatricopeptide repeat protein